MPTNLQEWWKQPDRSTGTEPPETPESKSLAEWWQQPDRRADMPKWEAETKEGPEVTAEEGLAEWQGGWEWEKGSNPSPTNHLGEKLPYGAEGWDFLGRAYYGDPMTFKGFWNELKSKFLAPYGYDAVAPEDVVVEEDNTIYTAPGWMAIRGGKEFKYEADVGKTIKNAWSALEYKDESATPVEKSLTAIVTAAKRVTDAVVTSVMRILQKGAVEVEKGLGAAETMGEYAREKGAVQPYPGWEEAKSLVHPAYSEKYGEPPELPHWANTFKAWLWNYGTIIPNVLAFTFSPGSPEVKKGILKTGYEAGRIFYTTAADPVLKAEMVRRVEAGENPYFLEQELGNPIYEMVGQLIFDPLNLIDLYGAISKSARLASMAIRYMDAPEEIRNYFRASEALDDVTAVDNMMGLTKVVKVAREKVISDITRLANDYSLGALLATGKRFTIGGRAMDYVHQVLGTASNTSEALDRLVDVTRVTGSEDDIATLLAGARHLFAPNVMFSTDGITTSYLIRKMIGETAEGTLDYAGFLADTKKVVESGDITKLIEHVDAKLAKAVEETFPTLTKMIEDGAKVNPLVKAAVFFDKYAQMTVFKPINSFLSAVYMGYSPGYMMRNVMQNFIQILIDEGPQAALGMFNPKLQTEAIGKMLGQDVKLPHSIGGFGAVKAWERSPVAGSGKQDIKNLKDFLVAAQLPRRGAEKAEYNASLALVRSVLEKTLDGMCKEGMAIPPLDDIIQAGMSRPQAEILIDLVKKHKDVNKALDEFAVVSKAKEIAVLATEKWMKQSTRASLGHFNPLLHVKDRTQDIIATGLKNNTPLDDIVGQVSKLFDDVLEDAKKVGNEAPVVADDAFGVEDVQLLGEEVLDEVKEVYTSHIAANYTAHQAIDMVGNGISEALTLLRPKVSKNILDKLRVGLREIEMNPKKTKIGELAEQNRLKYINNFLHPLQESKSRDMAAAWDNLTRYAQDAGFTLRRKPDNLTIHAFGRVFWEDFFFPMQNKLWDAYRDTLYLGMKAIGEDVIQALTKHGLDPAPLANNIAQMDSDYKFAQVIGEIVPDEILRYVYADLKAAGSKPNLIRAYAMQFGFASKAEGGADLDKALVNMINAYLPEGMKKYERIEQIDPDVARMAFYERYLAKKGISAAAGAAPEAAKAGEAAMEAPKVVKPILGHQGNMPSPRRWIHESRKRITEVRDEVIQGIKANYGLKIPVYSTPAVDKAIQNWGRVANQRWNDARIMGLRVAAEKRKFTLLSYPEKTGLDLTLAYLYPYQYWYNRTYRNWLKRLATNPGVVAAYAKYKEGMSRIHAEAPEWWRYTTSTNDLFGFESDHPLYFNLEMALNPMQGLTGVDFDDPARVVDWWTYTMDTLGKFGPSVFTLYPVLTALSLMKHGENQAAMRWGGRLFPQSSTLKSALSLLGVKNVTGEGVNEYDPLVNFFSNGIDPYEAKRAGRMLWEMADEGLYTAEQIMLASRAHSGPIWEEAVLRAQQQRAPGQLMAFGLGAGFKGRSPQDMQIDRFYTEMNILFAQKDNMPIEEYRQNWRDLGAKYPFGDAVLMSGKDPLLRDEALTWNVLERIPPGQKDNLLKLTGVDYDLLEKFYNDKGFEKWTQTDIDRFMATIVDLGAILHIPDDATMQEWGEASMHYSKMVTEIEAMYGDGIMDELGDSYGEELSPELQAAQDMKNQYILFDPLLEKYYASFSTVKNYYYAKYKDEIKEQVGEDIFDIVDAYYALTGKERSAFYKEHQKELRKYWDIKDDIKNKYLEHMVTVGEMLPDKPVAELQPGVKPENFTQEKVMEYLQEQQPTVFDISWDDWKNEINNVNLSNLLEDMAHTGKRIPESGYDWLDRLADKYGMEVDLLLQILLRSILNRQYVY